MKIDGYLKFLLTLFVIWLFFHTFTSNRYSLHNHSPFGDSEYLYRMDNLTGQTHVYDIKSGGWVSIVDTGLMIVPKEKN